MMDFRKLAIAHLAALAVAAAWAVPLAAQEPGSPSRANQTAQAGEEAWASEAPRVSDLDPRIARDLRVGRPLVSEVIIPLCSNDQINCGGRYAGQAGSLKANLYWNAAYGARRFFDDPKYGWSLVHAERAAAPLLATRVYRKRIPGVAWGVEGGIEQLAVLRAVHGNHINQALRDFYTKAIKGSVVTFSDGDRVRSERVHIVGYAGHNRMMDGIPLPKVEPEVGAAPLPAFVLACLSQQYFEKSMKRDGVPELVMTRTFMAPEAYVIDATMRGIGGNLRRDELRMEVVKAYAKWQRIDLSVAGATFAKL